MSMSINWKLDFPEVTFHHARVQDQDAEGVQTNATWDPAIDLKAHLEQWAPSADRFGGEDDQEVRRRDVGRHTILHRIQFEELEQAEQHNDDFNITLHRVWQMSLIPTEKVQTDAMMHADGEAFQLDRADQNELYVHRMNPINYLYDWLLTLDPRGRWGNAWLLPQCGVTEYDESVFNLSTFKDGRLWDCYIGGGELTSEGSSIMSMLNTRAALEEWIR